MIGAAFGAGALIGLGLWIKIPGILAAPALVMALPGAAARVRFTLAAALMLTVCAATGQRLRFPVRLHLRFAAMGVLLFSTNFLLFYYAAFGLVSGLLSVIFSTTSVSNILMNTLILRQPLRRTPDGMRWLKNILPI